MELFTFVENGKEDGTFYFKFSTLHQMYEERVQSFCFEKETNRTQLKEKQLAYFPQAQQQSDGKLCMVDSYTQSGHGTFTSSNSQRV